MNKYKDYLIGNKYTNAIKYKINTKSNLNRIDFIIERCKNKKVLHFGFLDHNINTIDNKISQGNWLHKRIIDVSNITYGVDILKEDIQKLKERGYSNLYCINILKDKIPNNLKNIDFDVIVLGEILEHINNPSQFLNIIKNNFNFKKIIVTVPNAFFINNFINSFKNKEIINSDHRYWFTPYTISKNIYLAGLSVKNIYFSNYALNRYNFIIRWIKLRFPFLNSTIILEVE